MGATGEKPNEAKHDREGGRSDESNPWTKLSTRVVFENPWLRVSHDDVINPAGHPTQYGVVHFKNHSVGILPIDEDGCTYLVGQWRYTMNAYSWEMPEGGAPVDGDPLEHAKRELQEETGLIASHWEKLFEADLSNSVTDESGTVFLARGLSLGPSSPEETEVLKLRRVPLDDVFDMVVRGEIRDLLTIAAVFRARVLQAEGRLPRSRSAKP